MGVTEEDCPIIYPGIKVYSRIKGQSGWELKRTLRTGTAESIWRNFSIYLPFGAKYEIQVKAKIEGSLPIESNIIATRYLCPAPSIDNVSLLSPNKVSIAYSYYCPDADGIKFTLVPTDANYQGFGKIISGPAFYSSSNSIRRHNFQMEVADGQHYEIQAKNCFGSCSVGGSGPVSTHRFKSEDEVSDCGL